MFWMICAALTGIVAAAIAAPLLRRQGAGTEPTAAYDLRVYRDQLREIGRDQERGVIDATDADRLRVEVGRKVLAADRALAAQGSARHPRGGVAALAVLALLLIGSVLLYRQIGQPDRPDQPIGLRIAEAQQIYDHRPLQAEAEVAAAKAMAQRPAASPAPDADYMALIEKLRDAVAKNPNDPRGLELLARHEEKLGNLIAAKDAQRQLVTLRGDQASAWDLARLAGLTVEAAGGVITREGEDAIAHALQRDPRNPQARFMAGLLQMQNGRPDRAFPIWAALLDEGPENAPWIQPIRASIGDLAWFAGQPDYTPPDATDLPEATALPGPDAGALAAAQDMSADERAQMIEGMVKGLEARLASQGGTPEEWARLVSSLTVIGQKDHAADILAEARTRFAGNQAALDLIVAAAEQAGLE